MDQRLSYQALLGFEASDACRLASIIKDLADERGSVSLAAIEAEWAKRLPRHIGLTGKRSIHKRIGSVLYLLRVARIACKNKGVVTIMKRDLLEMAVANLAIVTDADGYGIPRDLLKERPQVPNYLLPAQHARMQKHGQA